MPPIENVSDTARWIAAYRATESERPDAIFHDPFARRLAGTHGEEIVATLPRAQASSWALVVRTKVFDEIVLERVRRDNVDLVLNLAAGLDARAWRMPLPKTLRWVDVDLPDILDYKTNLLKDETPACRYDAVRLDLRDAAKRRALFTQLSGEAKRVLVVTEGLLIYLTPDQVSTLAADLHAARTFDWWLIDIASPRLLQIMLKYWGKSVQSGNAPFQFAPAEGTQIHGPAP